MPINTIILDVGHAGKPSKPLDRGCSYEGIYESDVTLQYAIFIRERFLLKEYNTFLITSGHYSERIRWANKHCDPKSSFYLSCHLNAASGHKGRYSLVEHYYDATEQTRQLAEHIATQFHQILETEYPSMSYAPGGVREIEKGGRGSVCLKNTNMSALLIEPFFLDNPEHVAKYYKRLATVARAVFNGVEEFNKS
jgi:N-acetylmuramoyl-L-alanine amidase